MDRFIIGSRDSRLAQAELQEALADLGTDQFSVMLHPTRAALREALHSQNIDVCVGSAKDLASEDPAISTVALSDSPDFSNALVTKSGLSFDELPPGTRIGVASTSVQKSLRAHRGDLFVEIMRGAVDERVQRLMEGIAEFDAVVIATIALRRLGLDAFIRQVLPTDLAPSHPDQGRLALSVLTRREEVQVALRALLQAKPNWNFR